MKKKRRLLQTYAAFALLIIAPKNTSAQEEQTTKLNEVDVIGTLDIARNQIVPSLGATKYEISDTQINTQSEGANAPFNEVLLRAPGVAQDSFGQVHVRGEHANLQYRINGVLLPEGLSGFGQELDTRFVDSISLMTGALPAQFGYQTAGVVDIRTKSGIFDPGGSASLYGGSFDTVRPSLEYGGSSGRLNYYVDANYLQNNLGIENPTSYYDAIHDRSEQYRSFGYLSYILDSTSRLSFILSSSGGWFEIPNTPGLTTKFTLNGVPSFDSSALNENQRELNDYLILAYQKSHGNFDMQLSAFVRYSGIAFVPDSAGDLVFNGVASNVNRQLYANGAELDASYHLGEHHTLRFGSIFTAQSAWVDTSTSVFPMGSNGNQSSSVPFSIIDNSQKWGFIYGIYLQDEWKIVDPLVINFGARFDGINAFANEYQVSPRVNVTYTPWAQTRLHAGYARYFTPPPLELVDNQSVQKFNNTTNASAVTQSSPVLSERAHYFDAGVTQEIVSGLQVGVDGYYKMATNQLDEGQFGTALIFSPFNYESGQIYGVEATATFKIAGFSSYGNFAFSRAMGKNIVSGQFLFAQDELDYIASNWVFLDHDQRYTASAGASYAFDDGTTFFSDIIVGSGLRSGFANTQELPAHYSWNIGFAHDVQLKKVGVLTARIDLINLTDQVYQLRNGTGIGVGAPQYGQRRSFFATLTFSPKEARSHD